RRHTDPARGHSDPASGHPDSAGGHTDDSEHPDNAGFTPGRSTIAVTPRATEKRETRHWQRCRVFRFPIAVRERECYPGFIHAAPSQTPIRDAPSGRLVFARARGI